MWSNRLPVFPLDEPAIKTWTALQESNLFISGLQPVALAIQPSAEIGVPDRYDPVSATVHSRRHYTYATGTTGTVKTVHCLDRKIGGEYWNRTSHRLLAKELRLLGLIPRNW